MNRYQSSLIRAMEVGLVDYEKGDETRKTLASQVIRGQRRFERVLAVFKLAKEVMPEAVEQSGILEKLLQNPSQLPFSLEQLRFRGRIGHGGENDVYLLESQKEDTPSWALKISRYTNGSLEHLTRVASELKNEYNRVQRAYHELSPRVIPPEHQLIVHGLQGGKGAVATLQPFIGNKLRDFFEDLTPRGRVRLMKENPPLAQDVTVFHRVTQERFSTPGGKVIDLLGPKNLSVLETEEGAQLLLLDPHPTFVGADDPERVARFNERLEVLSATVKEYERQAIEH